MEAIAFVETVSTLATTAFKVAQTIAQIVEDLKEAKSQIASVGTDTKAVSFVLRQLSERLKDFIAPLQPESSAYIQVKTITEDVISMCRKEIEGIELIIKPLMPSTQAGSITLKRKWKVAIKDQFAQLVEKTKNTELVLMVAEEADRDVRKKFGHHKLHKKKRSGTPDITEVDAASTGSLDEIIPDDTGSDHVSQASRSDPTVRYGEGERRRRNTRRANYHSGSSLTVSANESSSDGSGDEEHEDGEHEDADDEDEEAQIWSILPRSPGHHWQSKIKELLRVQQEVIDFASKAVVPYQHAYAYQPYLDPLISVPPQREWIRVQNTTANQPVHVDESVDESESELSESRPQLKEPVRIRRTPENQPEHVDAPDFSESKSPQRERVRVPTLPDSQPVHNHASNFAEPTRPLRDRLRFDYAPETQPGYVNYVHPTGNMGYHPIGYHPSQDPGYQLMQERFEEKCKVEDDRQQREAVIKSEADRMARERIEAEQEAKAEQLRRETLLTAEAERNAQENYEAMKRAEDESKVEQERQTQLIQDKTRQSILADQKAAEEAKAAAELKSAQKRELFRLKTIQDHEERLAAEKKAMAKEEDMKAKDDEIRNLTAQLAKLKLDEAVRKVRQGEEAMWEERQAWLKEKYALKEEALRAKSEALNEVRGDFGVWLGMRPHGNVANGHAISPRPRAESESSGAVSRAVRPPGFVGALGHRARRRMRRLFRNGGEQILEAA